MEPRFDRLAGLVRDLLGVPTALISLVEEERQFFKSCLGLPEPWASTRETPLSHSFCQYVVHAAAPFVIEDARTDPVLRTNGAVHDLGVVAYAGMPIRDGDGVIIGSLCAIDVVPRRWSERELTLLEALAAAVSSEVNLHRRTSLAFAEADASYREVIDSLDEVVFRADLDGTWTWLSPAWQRVSGYSVEESLGSSIWALVDESDREESRRRVEALFAGNEDALRKAIRGRRANGSSCWVGIRARVTRDESGRVDGMIGTLNDVTDRMEEQRLLGEARDRLAASSKLEALGRMAASIAHDFNNILAGAGGYAGLLQSDPELSDQTRADAAAISASVQQGARLVRQLLQFGGDVPIALESLSLNEVARDGLRIQRSTLPSCVRLEERLHPDLPACRADRSQLEQVMSNLLVNARDAMPDGGVLTISTGACSDEAGARAVWLEVTDTGLGMDEATQARVCEPFFTTKAAVGGSGLGLATVQGIVSRLGGSIAIESALGAGTTFRVTLPADESEVEWARR